MSPPRFYCPLPLVARQQLELPEDLAHHAVRVRRLRDGSAIILFDGNGGQYPATLQVESKRASALLGERVEAGIELPVHTVLVQGIAGGDKMDWVVEKAVEMGVAQLVPILAERSVVRLAGERREKRLRHWQRIAVAASEQCGRDRIMQVEEPQGLAQWLERDDPGMLRLACHPGAALRLAEAAQDHTGAIALMVGPEGGWSDEELALMAARGYTAVRFGSRVLRSETAGIALMAALAAIKGWE